MGLGWVKVVVASLTAIFIAMVVVVVIVIEMLTAILSAASGGALRCTSDRSLVSGQRTFRANWPFVG